MVERIKFWWKYEMQYDLELLMMLGTLLFPVALGVFIGWMIWGNEPYLWWQ